MPMPDRPPRHPPRWVPDPLREPMRDGQLLDRQAHALLARRLREYSQGEPTHRSWATGSIRRLLVTVPLVVGSEWNGGVAIFWKSRSQEPRPASVKDIMWFALLNDWSLVQRIIDRSLENPVFTDAVEEAMFSLAVEMARLHGDAYPIPVARDVRTRSEFVNLVLANPN